MHTNRDGFAGNQTAIGLIILMASLEIVVMRAPLAPLPECRGHEACEYMQDSNTSYAALGLRACPCGGGRVSILVCLKGIPDPTVHQCAYPGQCRAHSPIPKRLKCKIPSRVSTSAR